MSVDKHDTQLNHEMPDEPDSSGIFYGKKIRYAMGVEYRGTHYSGWQRQDSPHQGDNDGSPSSGAPLNTIQLKVEQALGAIANESITTICAGRTDSGVHAREQVIHFDTSAVRPDKAWILGVNTHLPDDISVHWVKQVDSDFHARFSAIARSYRYFINNQTTRPALSRELMTSIWRPLDHEAMHTGAQYLLGENDFSSFRGNSCQSKTPFRLVHHVDVQRQGAIVVMDIKANAFLHHMVRNIMGVLIKVGHGEKPASWVREVLEAKTRTAAGITAPPNGLYLMRVDYPQQYQLPRRTVAPLKGQGAFEGILASHVAP